MKCNYQNFKQKTIISNGKKVSIIKKKYKKIYSYPIRSTLLFFVLKKNEIINLIRKTQPILVNKNGEEFARIIGDINFQDKKFVKWLLKYD